MRFKLASKRTLHIALLFFAVFYANSVQAEIKYYDLTNPFLRKIPMAVPAFKALSSTSAEKDVARSLADKVQEMLEFTGYFKMLDRGSFLYDPQSSGITETQLNFANWTAVGAEMLITGGVQVTGTSMVAELRLFYSF